jgi:hypothetical protein
LAKRWVSGKASPQIRSKRRRFRSVSVKPSGNEASTMHRAASNIRDPMQNRSSPDNAIKRSRTICLTSGGVSFKGYSPNYALE